MNDKQIRKAAAIKYDQAQGMAPRVVAKGKGHIADQIIRVAPPKDFRAQDFPARQVNEDYLKGEMEEAHAE